MGNEQNTVEKTAIPALRRMARTCWLYGVGAWIAAYNPLGLQYLGKCLMAHVLSYITHDLTPTGRNIRSRRAARAAVVEVEAVMEKERASGR